MNEAGMFLLKQQSTKHGWDFPLVHHALCQKILVILTLSPSIAKFVCLVQTDFSIQILFGIELLLSFQHYAAVSSNLGLFD